MESSRCHHESRRYEILRRIWGKAYRGHAAPSLSVIAESILHADVRMGLLLVLSAN